MVATAVITILLIMTLARGGRSDVLDGMASWGREDDLDAALPSSPSSSSVSFSGIGGREDELDTLEAASSLQSGSGSGGSVRPNNPGWYDEYVESKDEVEGDAAGWGPDGALDVNAGAPSGWPSVPPPPLVIEGGAGRGEVGSVFDLAGPAEGPESLPGEVDAPPPDAVDIEEAPESAVVAAGVAQGKEAEDPVDAAPPSTTTTTTTKTVSISILPPVALTFHCIPQDDDEAADALMSRDSESFPCRASGSTDAELGMIAASAETYVRDSRMMEEALAFDLEVAEGILYRGMELEARLAGPGSGRWRLLRGGQVAPGPTRGRRLGGASDRGAVLLSGEVRFGVAPGVSPTDPSIPSQTHLSQLLLTILAGEKSGRFLGRMRAMAKESGTETESWLLRAVGFHVSFGGERVPVSSANNDANGGGGDGVNTLLIVGAAGAGLSLILLVGGLCYAKRSYKQAGAAGAGDGKHNGAGAREVVFQPGKNNPRSSSGGGRGASLFRKKAGSVGEGAGPGAPAVPSGAPSPAPPVGGNATNDLDDAVDDDDDDEDFLLARAALDHSAKKADRANGDGVSVADSQANNTFGDDMSYSFTVDGESLAPLSAGGGCASNAGSSSNPAEDAMVGAGGLSSFANERGVFRWNGDGTKMVYTPNIQKSGESSSEDGRGGPGEQNGFVFDDKKKKWVVKERVVGEKNVSFAGTGAPSHPTTILRTRSNDSAGTGISAGTGMTGLTEFTYDDIAPENARRSRSGGTEPSGMSSLTPMRVPGVTLRVPPSPSTPREQGVEVEAPSPLLGSSVRPSDSHDDSEFAPDTNVERFMMGPDAADDSTAFSGITDVTGGAAAGPGAVGGQRQQQPQPLAMPMPPPAALVHAPSRGSVDTLANPLVGGAGGPSRVVPRRIGRIAEDAPFDEDIPFDERTRSGLSAAEEVAAGRVTGDGGLVMPEILGDRGGSGAGAGWEDDGAESEASEDSANSEQVLEDLDKLSRFMMERKRSSKNQGSVSSTRRTRKGVGLAGGGGSTIGIGGGTRVKRKSLLRNGGPSGRASARS